MGASPRARTRTLVSDPLGGTVRRTVLPNGLRVLTEAIPAMRSVSLGIWVAVGSRDERPGHAGASHFLEHLLFKGTKRRDALEISSAIEGVGGETNAFTDKEYTCFHTRVLDTDLPLAVDVLCDLLTSSLLTEAEVETERGVILEEIAMTEDEPADAVHDLFAGALFDSHPLGRPVAGTVETISAMSRRQIQTFYRGRYTAPQLVVSAAGNLDHGKVVRLVREAFAASGRFDEPAIPAPLRAAEPRPPVRDAVVRVEVKDTEQAHVVLGRAGLVRTDPRRFALGVLNNVLGGGMSSRLFQRVREERGLAYSVFSHTLSYADCGLFGVYAGCTPANTDEVLAIVVDELATVAEHGVTDAEVARGKGMLRGGLVLGLEDTGSRMSRLGKGELLYGDLMSVDELLARIDAVSVDDVRTVATEVLTGPKSLAVIGPFDHDHDFTKAMGASA